MIVIKTFTILFIVSNVCMGSDPDSLRGVNYEREFEWTPELEAIVTRIFHETKSEGENQVESMKKEWDRILPQFKRVKASTIHEHALTLIYKNSEKSEGYNRTLESRFRRTQSSRYHRVNWEPERESNLIRMYCDIASSGKKGVRFKLYNGFYGKYPDAPRMGSVALWKRAKNRYEERKPAGADDLRTRIRWDEEYGDELVRIYHEKARNSEDEAQKLYEEWVELHPEHRRKKASLLRTRMRNIIRQRVGEDLVGYITSHKWTKEENADLLHIHRRLKSEGTEYSSKLHERWVKMYPDLGYMDKELLRHRANHLIRKNYQPTRSEDEKARVKFDKLPPAANVIGSKKRRLIMDKGKSKIDPADDHPEHMNQQLQESRPYQFHDFMSPDGYHGRSSRNFDENVQGSYMENRYHIPHYDPNTDLNLGNYHPGESSNPPSHQQPDPGSSSASQNTTRPFFKFV